MVQFSAFTIHQLPTFVLVCYYMKGNILYKIFSISNLNISQKSYLKYYSNTQFKNVFEYCFLKNTER